MGGRGSASGKGRIAQAKKIEQSSGGAGTTAKATTGSAGGKGNAAADAAYNTSVKSLTKGLTQEKIKKMTRNQLVKIAIVQGTKYQKDVMGKWTKGGISTEEAYHRALGLIVNTTTAQLRKSVWKNRNMD